MAFGPRKLRYAFTAQTLTHFGGVYLLHRFLSHLHLKRLLAQKVRFPQRNNSYSVSEMVLALIYPMILGLERIETAHLLRQNGVFQYLAGLIGWNFTKNNAREKFNRFYNAIKN